MLRYASHNHYLFFMFWCRSGENRQTFRSHLFKTPGIYIYCFYLLISDNTLFPVVLLKGEKTLYPLGTWVTCLAGRHENHHSMLPNTTG